jgi:hypothetical protein
MPQTSLESTFMTQSRHRSASAERWINPDGHMYLLDLWRKQASQTKQFARGPFNQKGELSLLHAWDQVYRDRHAGPAVPPRNP